MTWVAGVLLPVVLLYQGWTYYVFRRRLGAPVATAQIPSPRPPAEQRAGQHRTDPGRTHVREH
jgi:hypothetical protein